MPDLPAEIWSIVACNAERSDLLRFALVVPLHRNIAQNILATDLHLGSSPTQDYRKVLSALKEKNLLHRTHHLTIGITENEALDVVAVPVEQMPNLRDLSLSVPESLFETSELQEVFVLRLKEFCKKLQSVSVRLAAFEKVLPGQYFSIPNLCSINWNEGGRIGPAFFSLCSASLKTITCLMVYVWAEEGQHHAPCLELFGFRFPKLKTLKIGPGDDCGCFHTKPNRQKFTQFLIAHPSIEHLTLDQWSLDGTSWNYAYLGLEFDMLSPYILPNIVSLQAYPEQVIKFANAGALFIKTMRKLVIWQNEVGNITPEVQSMLEAFKEYADAVGPLQLLEFNLLLSHMRENYNIDRAPIKPILEAVYDVFPRLEIYVGDIAELDDLWQLRSRLRHLREVRTTSS